MEKQSAGRQMGSSSVPLPCAEEAAERRRGEHETWDAGRPLVPLPRVLLGMGMVVYRLKASKLTVWIRGK